jgi:hypothetical protein
VAAITRTSTECWLRAQPVDGLFLQKAQQVGLQLQRQIANFIEEERAALRAFDQAALSRQGAGRRRVRGRTVRIESARPEWRRS